MLKTMGSVRHKSTYPRFHSRKTVTSTVHGVIFHSVPIVHRLGLLCFSWLSTSNTAVPMFGTFAISEFGSTAVHGLSIAMGFSLCSAGFCRVVVP